MCSTLIGYDGNFKHGKNSKFGSSSALTVSCGAAIMFPEPPYQERWVKIPTAEVDSYIHMISHMISYMISQSDRSCHILKLSGVKGLIESLY